ncbi:hypothetical protein HPG69_002545 [Diceros bicornis minor]|uniref:Glutathione S-transferase n=1 Tax=Diceros bicornis minor TaxID=77932 RepID=A0A7J7FP11_DICBM|nr:hypothetical protein HPG69_002545 [Diceros bicornis minor]
MEMKESPIPTEHFHSNRPSSLPLLEKIFFGKVIHETIILNPASFLKIPEAISQIYRTLGYINPEPGVMAAKPKLYYFRGRGRMEPIRWLLAAAGVEFEEEFLETRERYEKLQKDGHLLFGQVPLVEIDGMMLTQTTAILSYLAAKEGPEGESQVLECSIDMYADGTLDLMMMIALAAFKPREEKEENIALVVGKAKTRYFPVFEKILKDHGEDFLVGNKFSWADIQLLEAVLMVEELSASVLSDFPLLKAFKTRISNIPTIKKFLQAGSQRKPPPDSHYVEAVKTVLQFSWQRQSEQTIVSRSKVFEKSKTITPSTANAD